LLAEFFSYGGQANEGGTVRRLATADRRITKELQSFSRSRKSFMVSTVALQGLSSLEARCCFLKDPEAASPQNTPDPRQDQPHSSQRGAGRSTAS
jgi:hypothetical protein